MLPMKRALSALVFALSAISLTPGVGRAATGQQLLDRCQTEVADGLAWAVRTGTNDTMDTARFNAEQAAIADPPYVPKNIAIFEGEIQRLGTLAAQRPSQANGFLEQQAWQKMFLCFYRARVAIGDTPPARSAPPPSQPASASGSRPPSSGPSSLSSGAADAGPKSASGRSYNERPSPAAVVEGQKAIDEIERLENGARDYVKGGEEEGEDATDCVKLERSPDGYQAAKLVVDQGACPYRVEVVWCTEGLDCKPSFTNQTTIGPGPDKYAKVSGTSGASRNAYVRWGACRGANTIHQNGMPSLMFYCTKERQ